MRWWILFRQYKCLRGRNTRTSLVRAKRRLFRERNSAALRVLMADPDDGPGVPAHRGSSLRRAHECFPRKSSEVAQITRNRESRAAPISGSRAAASLRAYVRRDAAVVDGSARSRSRAHRMRNVLWRVRRTLPAAGHHLEPQRRRGLRGAGGAAASAGHPPPLSLPPPPPPP